MFKHAGKFKVCRCNGTGGMRSDWAVVSSHGTIEDAHKAAVEFAASTPECDGWNANIAVMVDGDVVVWVR